MYEREIDIKELLIVLRRHIYLFTSVFIIVMILTAAHIFRAQRIFSSTVSIEIEPKAANVLGQGMEIVSTGTTGYYWNNSEYYATQYEIIQSRAVAEKVLEQVPGDNILEYLGLDISKIEPDALKGIDPVDIILAKVTVSPQKKSNIVKISVEDPDPEKAAFYANGFAAAYIDFNLEKKYFATKDAARWLSDQSINLKKSLEDSEKTLFDFKEINNVLATTFEDKQRLLSTRIEKLTNTLTDQDIKKNSLAAKIEEFNKIDIENLNESFLKEVSKDNQLINSLKMKYFEVLSRLDESEKFYGDKYPLVLSLNAEKKVIKDSLIKEISGVVSSYDLELKTLENEMLKNRKMLAEAQKEAINLNKLDIDYSKLKREVETNKKLYDIVLERTKQADLSALLKNNNVRIIDDALVSKIPVKPRKNLILLIGLIIAAISGSLAIFSIEFFDTRFRNFKEFELLTKKPLLGIVPRFEHFENSKFKEIAFEDKKQNLAVEAFRSLRTNIKLSNPDNVIKKILVTSSISKEGKTTVSTNLAVGYSFAGKKVILIDADMRKPRIHKMFGLKNEIGLSNLIVGEHTIDQSVNKNVYEGLDLLTCGPIPPNPAELLESHRFIDLLKEISGIYDIVIFDSPPLHPVSDAATVASLMDGVVLVVNINKTPRDIFKAAVSKITMPGINLMGTVINNFDLKQEKKFKSYYAYSYYHSPYQNEENNDA